MRLQTFAGLNNIAKSIENHDMLILTWKELFWEKGQCCYSMYGMLGRHHYTILRALHQGICLYAIFSNQNWPNFKISTDFRVCWCCLPNELLLFGSSWEINYDKLVGRMMFYDIYDVLKLLRDINIAGIALENPREFVSRSLVPRCQCAKWRSSDFFFSWRFKPLCNLKPQRFYSKQQHDDIQLQDVTRNEVQWYIQGRSSCKAWTKL